MSKFEYRLEITKSCYFQDGEECPVDVPYLNFQQDGNVTLSGSDDVGDFEFTGRAEDQYLYLNKQYIGQHTLYYTGKLEGNKLNMFYAFEEDHVTGKQKVDAGEFNSLMEFNAEQFRFFRDGAEGDNWQLFLTPKDNGKSKGLGDVKGKCVKISYKPKDDNTGKLQMKYKDYERCYKVTKNNNDFIVESNDENEYKMEAVQSFYLIEGMEYSFYLPYLTFDDKGKFKNNFTDNNGEFQVEGEFEGDFLVFKKSYESLNVYFVGKFKGKRFEMAYSFSEGQNEDLKEKVNNGEYMAYTEFNLTHYTLDLEGESCHTFLLPDEDKYRGFSIHGGKNFIVSAKDRDGKKSKLKMKRDKEIRLLKVDMDHDQFLINLAMPMGMGL